jgi:hypothetical protein
MDKLTREFAKGYDPEMREEILQKLARQIKEIGSLSFVNPILQTSRPCLSADCLDRRRRQAPPMSGAFFVALIAPATVAIRSWCCDSHDEVPATPS